MSQKIKVAVLMGGFSAEREISLMSGKNVLASLDQDKFISFPVVLKKRSVFALPKKLKSADVVFITLHGPFGEDGTIQGMLELLRLPYTGSGVLASAVGMDKIMFRKVMSREGILTPEHSVVTKGESGSKVGKLFSPPVFVKPHNQGSSVGVSSVKKKTELTKALNRAFSHSDKVLVEEYLEGIEVTCGLLGNENPQALPVTEVVPKREFFDYEAKYNEKLCDEITPARISAKLTKAVQDLALRVYRAIGARGFSRVDFIITKRGPVVLEINTIPGLTPVSLFPKQAAAAGISYPELIEKIIKLALES